MSNNELVKGYLENINGDLFNSNGIKLPESVINSIVTKYDGSDLEVNELIESVNDDVQAYIDQVIEEGLDLDLGEKQEDAKSIDDMDKKEETEKKNVVLNNTDLNLIAIATASTPEELQVAMNKCPYLNKRLVDSNLYGTEFENTKRNVFEMYRDSIPAELRDVGELNLNTIDDYISFFNTLHNEYDTVTMDDGTKDGKVYDLKSDDDVSLEEMRTSDTKEIEAGTNESALERDVPNVVDTEGNLEEKHRIDIDNENQKDEASLNRSGDVMLGTAVGMAMAGAASEKMREVSGELNEMLKDPSVEADTKVKDINKPKVLKLNDNKNTSTNDDSYKQAGMAMSDSLLLIIFMIVFIIFIGVIYFFTK